MILSLYKKLLEKTPLATSHTPNTNDILDVDSEILTDETIKYKDVAIGLPHKAGARKRANEEAIMLMNDLKSDMREPTDAEKKILQGYTGNGGLGGIGSEDEYYTPAWVAKGAWDMLGDMPNGAKVLDPSAGMGIFARNMPNGIDMTEIELDSTSATLNKMITDLPLLHGTFQEQSYKIEDNSLDGVITNVPFAKVDDIGDERFKGIKRLEQYFIIRSLELLKPSKRAVFLVPTGVLDNNRTRDYKDKILDLASFVGGVRLPNKVFSHTGADVAVDILVFEKHREDAVKALKDNYVTYPSRQEVILGDKQNNAFYFGTYFTAIGKRNLLGKYISSSEFQESHFMGQTAHPKSAVLTTKSLDDIKEQVAKLSKTKFHNTVDYDKLQLLGNVSITDKLALQTLRENDDFRAYFREFDNAIYERKNITVKELKLFAEKYDKFAEKSNNAQLLSIFGRTYLYLPVMAINFHKKKVTKHTLDMLKALIFAKFTNETRTDKENKGYLKHNKELSSIVETSYVKKFKESIEYHDQQRINENITITLAQLTAKLNSNWNFKLNEPIKQLEFKKFKTIEDVLQGKGLNLAKEFNNWGYKASVLTPQEILDIDDVFLAKDGNVTPASWIVYNGSKYKDAISHIDSLEYSKEYGLTEDEFQEKIHSMRGIVNSHKDAVSLDTLTLNHKSVSSLVGENEMTTVKRIAQEIADGMPLAYIKSDNIIKTKNIAKKSMGSLDDDKDVVIEEIEEVESIEFPTNFSISTFYAKNWESNFKVLWARHEEAIKQTLGVKDYSEASRQYQYLKAKRDDEGGKNLAAPVEFFGKLKPIIMQDILSYRDSFDMQLDTKLKLNPTVSKKIKETLDRDAIIKISDSQKHEPIESLRRYVNDSVIDTNHGYQNEDIRHFSTALKGTMAQDTGLGKALDDNEVVLTPNGFKRNGDIIVGDFVIGSSGKPIEVLGVYPQGEKDIYEVTFFDNTSIRCTLDHLWTVNERSGTKSERDTYKTIDLKTMLEKPISKDIFDKRYGTTSKAYKYSIPFTPECEFGTDENLPIDPYLLGLLLGDGGFTHGDVSFTNKHKHIVDKVIKILPQGISASFKHSKGAYNASLVSEKKTKGRNYLINELKKLGLMGKYSHEKFIPEIYKNATLKSRQALIQGLVDTDGHILKNGNIEYSSSSEELIEDYKYLALSIGIRLGATTIKENPKYTYKDEAKYGKTAYRITSRTQRVKNKSIIDVKKIGSNNATCIRVNSKDALYVAGLGFNLTHNTRSIFMSALLAVTTNRAKRALVVVPTAVYDKWVMEVRDGKDDGAGNKADSILNEEGKKIVTYTKSSTAEKDWSNFIKSEELRIMLMPHSVFETFVFKKATIKKLFGTSKEEERANKDNPDFRAVPNRLPDFNARDWGYVVKQPSNTIGYFEDGKIDFIIIDEGQMAKNSSTGGKTVKFASAIQSSRYGVVLRTTQAIINNETFNGTGQGVVVATATPFTSSPLEIYTMLKNTGGLDSFDDFTDFEDTFMVVSEREEVMATDPNRKSLVKVFEGLDNLSILRNQGLTSIIYRNAEDESKREVNGSLGSGALKPAKETFDVSLEESEDVLMARADLIQKNGLFKEFKKEVIDRGLFAIPASDLDKSDKAIIASYRQSILSEYGLDITDSIQRAEVARKASTFSLVHGLNMLSINKDMALKDTITLDISNLDKETLGKLTSKLLKTKVQYKDIEQFHDKDGELCEKEITVKVTMDDFLQSRNLQLVKGNILSVPAIDEKIVKTIFDITTDSNLLKIEDYPKYKTVLENISKELKENPKAKQLIFSVSIVGARILEYFVSRLYKELEINPHKVMSALNIQETKAKKGDNEQDVGALAQFQENYNNSKVSTTLIFTTRNSTGVDFNKMTKAIHLVDIPYTPDVWHQAEGRGVRQGNKIDKVHVYQYSATGTLDTMKKVLLSEKGAWQEEIKNNDSVNSISSIQVEGKKLIEEVMANNPNATEDDIRAIIKEKQSEREEIVKKENQLKVEAVKQSVSDSNKLIQLQHETDKTNQLAYLGDYADFKGSAKHVDIFNSDITGKKVLDNLKKNGYKAVQMFVANAISTGAYKDKEALNEELAEITLDMEFVKENSSHRVESQRYLLALLNSTQHDKSKDYYEVSSTYTPAKIIPLSEEEASYKKEAGYKVNKRPLLTDNQYQDANMTLEQYLERAKIDIETKVLSVIEAESIFKDAVKNAIGVVNKDEKELYQGLLLGEMVYTISGDIVRLEDSVKQYQGEYRSTYIEVVPNQLISLTDIKPKTYEVTDEYKFLGRVAKTQPNIADALSLYHAAMEKLKDNLERNKNKIVKYFDTPAEAPVFSKDTFKGVGSLVKYLEVLKLVRVDLKDFDKFGELDYIAASSEFIFKGLKDEVVTFGRNTLAIIKGNIFTTTKFIRVRGDEELSSTPILDQAYKTPFNSNRIGDVSKIDQYDYSFLVRVFDAELDDIKGMIRFDSYNFQEINGVLYPYYTPAIAYKEYLEHLGKEEDKAIVAEELSNGGASDQSFDDIMDIINGTTEDKRKDILDSIMALDFQDQKLKSLGEMLQLARDGKIAEYNSHSDESQPIGIHVSTDLKVVVTNGKPINDFKTTRGRGAWATAGITYNKNSKTVYELDGTQKEYMNTWEIEVTEDNLITARSV